MIKFFDMEGKVHLSLCEITAKRKVNGEKSLSGTIYSNEYVLQNIDKGFRLEFNNEIYHVTYALPEDSDNTFVEFDAIHEFFYLFGKKCVYSTMNGSHSFGEYLNFIFNDSGYSFSYDVQVQAFEKENFGMKNRLALFNDIITSTGTEFEIIGKSVHITKRVGNDLSSIVRKKLNMQELKIEKNIGSFITYAKGFGAFKDPEDESKGRLVVEYKSELADIYGVLEGDPLIDERYTQESSLKEAVKKMVDSSYSIAIGLTLQDLSGSGYDMKMPQAGDYIMVINETLGFEQKIRIISIEENYDVQKNLIDYKVECNSISAVEKKQQADSTLTKTLNDIMSGNSRIPNDWLTNAVNVATELLLKSETEIKHTSNGLLAIDKNNVNNIVIFTSNGIGVSSNGGKSFENAITSKGINASLIKVGSIEASLLKLSWNTISDSIQITGNGLETFENEKRTLGIKGSGMYVYHPTNTSAPLFSVTRAGTDSSPFGIIGIRQGQPLSISRKIDTDEKNQTYETMMSFDPDTKRISLISAFSTKNDKKGLKLVDLTISGNKGIAMLHETANCGFWFGENGEIAYQVKGTWKGLS